MDFWNKINWIELHVRRKVILKRDDVSDMEM
jgi:hypothetical protein